MKLEEVPTPRTIPEMWPLAALKAKHGGRSISVEILDQINEWLAGEVEKARTDPDVVVCTRALVGARQCFRLLCRHGYREFLPHLREMELGIFAIKRICLKELVRRLLVGTIDEEKAAECLQILSELIDTGQWPDWREDWCEWEDEVCAKLAAKTAAAT